MKDFAKFFFFILLTIILCFVISKNVQYDLDYGLNEPNNPEERIKLYLDQRGGWIDDVSIKESKNILNKIYKDSKDDFFTKDAGVNNWEFMGPDDVGGRIRTMAINPNNAQELYIGAVAGGVWKSSNGGTSWLKVTPEPMSEPIVSLAIDPTSPNIIYAGTGEIIGTGSGKPGNWIYKSEDGGNTWNNLPLPAGVNSVFWVQKVYIDPNDNNTIYALTSSGDENLNISRNAVAYISDDAGQSWTEWLRDNNSIAFHNMSINPSDPNNIIVGGLWNGWVSNDGGSEWYRMTNGQLSRNGGITWTASPNTYFTLPPISTNPSNSCWFQRRVEIARCPNNPSIVYALRYQIERQFNASGNCTGSGAILNFREELWQSSNNGQSGSWNLRWNFQDPQNPRQDTMSILCNQGDFDNTLWVNPNNCQMVVAGGINLWRSIDGGNNFNIITDWRDDIGGSDPNDPDGDGINNSIHADQHFILEGANFNGTSNQQVFVCNDGGIYSTNNISSVTTNTGWNSHVNFGITQFYGAAISSNAQFLLGGTQDNSLVFSSDGGNNWGIPQTGDGGNAVITLDGNGDYIGFGNTNFGQIWRTFDEGLIWRRIAILSSNNSTCINGCVQNSTYIINDSPCLIAPLVGDPNDNNVILTSGERLLRNPSQGNQSTWTIIKGDIPVPGTQISTIEVDNGSSSRIWVGYNSRGSLSNGIVERTLNMGANWSGDIGPGVNNSVPSNPFVTDIAINPNNSNEVIVAYGGYFESNLWYTSNGNSSNPTWSNISLSNDTEKFGPDFVMHISSVIWHPSNSNWIYVGTDSGIFASDDKGQTWSVTPLYSVGLGGEGPIYTEVSELFWQPGRNRLCAATHGRGIWRSNEIKDKIYVDKDQICIPIVFNCDGSSSRPYNTFQDALEAAGHGSEIIFLSSGDHEEIPAGAAAVIADKRITITLDNNGSGAPIPVVIK